MPFSAWRARRRYVDYRLGIKSDDIDGEWGEDDG